jgi:hypothetical protein
MKIEHREHEGKVQYRYHPVSYADGWSIWEDVEIKKEKSLADKLYNAFHTNIRTVSEIDDWERVAQTAKDELLGDYRAVPLIKHLLIKGIDKVGIGVADDILEYLRNVK